MGVVHNDTQRAYPHSVVKAYMPKICVLFFTALLFFLKRYFSTVLCFVTLLSPSKACECDGICSREFHNELTHVEILSASPL